MNVIKISGLINDIPQYSHTTKGEDFFSFYIESRRTSGAVDNIPCIVSEVLIDMIPGCQMIQLEGEIRSRNIYEDGGKTKTEYFVFVRNVSEYSGTDINIVDLHGFICRKPNYRETPAGKCISDFIVASNRINSFKADYLPVIAWGRTAMRVDLMDVGTEIKISGRFQSRAYQKRINETETEIREAYELSCMTIMEINDESKNNDGF